MSWEDDLWNEYQRVTGKDEISAPEVAHWALANRKYVPDPVDEVTRLAMKLSRGWRNAHFIDPQGRSVRRRHAVTNKQGQEKMTFWHEMRETPTDIMKRALQQRRDQSVADNFQMKTDMDSYNQNYNKGKQITMVFDYSEDIRELEEARRDLGKTS